MFVTQNLTHFFIVARSVSAFLSGIVCQPGRMQAGMKISVSVCQRLVVVVSVIIRW
jgi:hypothetical protein